MVTEQTYVVLLAVASTAVDLKLQLGLHNGAHIFT